MSVDLVNLDMLFFQKDIQSILERAKCGKQMHTHEVRKIKPAVRCSCKKRTAFLESGDALT